MKIIHAIQLDFVDLKVYDNGIFHSHYHTKYAVTLEQVEEVTNIRRGWKRKIEKSPMLITMKYDYLLLREEVSQYLHAKGRRGDVLGYAYVTEGLSQKIAMRSALLQTNSFVPRKGFKSKKEAIEWLLNLKVE